MTLLISVNYCNEKYRKDLKTFLPVAVKNMRELAEIVSTRPWSPSVFRNNHRSNDDVIETSLLVLDYDNGSISLDEMTIILETEGYRYLIGTSLHHRKEKHGERCDRFRVILFPANKPETNKKQYRGQVFRFHKRWPTPDDSCLDPCRFYSPSPVVAGSDGLPVVFEQPTAIETIDKKDSRNYEANEQNKQTGRLPPKLELFVNEGVIYGESRRKCCFLSARKLAILGWSLDSAMRAVINAPFDKSEFKKEDHDDLPRQIENGYKAGRQESERQQEGNANKKNPDSKGRENPDGRVLQGDGQAHKR